MLKTFLPKSNFTKNVLTLMTGTTIAQAIPVAISPILTRIYTPEDFGVLAVFIAITAIFGSIATGRYELAIVLPEAEKDSLNIAILAVAISWSLSAVLMVLVLVFSETIADSLGNNKIEPWLYLAPFSVFFIGFFNALNFYATRVKRFSSISYANVTKSLIVSVVQLSVGFVSQGALGLISGQFVAQALASLVFLQNLSKFTIIRGQISFENVKKMGGRYSDFPKFSLWAVLANSLSTHSANLLISSLFSITTLGLYSIVQRVLGLPSLIIGASIGNVFFQAASKEKNETGKAINSFNSAVKNLCLFIPIFIVLFFVVEDLFVFVFGEKWRVSGIYAQILTPMFAIRFVSAPISVLVSVFEKNFYGLIINSILLISTLAIITVGSHLDLPFKAILIWLSAGLSFLYLMFLFFYRRLAYA